MPLNPIGRPRKQPAFPRGGVSSRRVVGECGDGEAGDGDAGDDVGCEAHVEMTIREYEAVRSQDDRFVLHPGHEQEAIESVAARNERFVIVDKRPSVERFVEDDPRGAPSE
jgi:hypothetical protein